MALLCSLLLACSPLYPLFFPSPPFASPLPPSPFSTLLPEYFTLRVQCFLRFSPISPCVSPVLPCLFPFSLDFLPISPRGSPVSLDFPPFHCPLFPLIFSLFHPAALDFPPISPCLSPVPLDFLPISMFVPGFLRFPTCFTLCLPVSLIFSP